MQARDVGSNPGRPGPRRFPLKSRMAGIWQYDYEMETPSVLIVKLKVVGIRRLHRPIRLKMKGSIQRWLIGVQ